jgi:hypothetical protein
MNWCKAKDRPVGRSTDVPDPGISPPNRVFFMVVGLGASSKDTVSIKLHLETLVRICQYLVALLSVSLGRYSTCCIEAHHKGVEAPLSVRCGCTACVQTNLITFHWQGLGFRVWDKPSTQASSSRYRASRNSTTKQSLVATARKLGGRDNILGSHRRCGWRRTSNAVWRRLKGGGVITSCRVVQDCEAYDSSFAVAD